MFSLRGSTVRFDTEDSSTTSDEDLVQVVPPRLSLLKREVLACLSHQMLVLLRLNRREDA